MDRDLHLPTIIRPSADFIRSYGATFTYPSIIEYALGQDSFVVMYVQCDAQKRKRSSTLFEFKCQTW